MQPTHTACAVALLLALPASMSPLAPLGPGSIRNAGDTRDVFNWPQWDGPERNGLSRETNWSAVGKEENLWEAQVGLGYSTVSVQDGRLVTMGYDVDAGLDTIWCFDALTGKELWAHSYESDIWNRAHEGGTVNTPSFDGDVVYSLNREGNLFCIEAESGEVRWHTDLMPEDNMFELEHPTWGWSASPLVLEDELLLNCGAILSVDKETGEIIWRSKDYGHGYGTPAAFELEGKRLVAVLNGTGVAVVSREDGEEVYFHEFAGQGRGVNAATPIVIDDALFVSSGTIPAGALLACGEGELIPVWENREMANSFSGCVRIGDCLYGFDQQILKCLDLEGETRWQVRGVGNGAVSGTPDRILVMGATGELIVAEANPKEFKELSRVKLFDTSGENYWTKPILANGIVYCRSSKGALVARDHRSKQ